MPLPRIIITPGEPAGIGPDVLIAVAQEAWQIDVIAIADPEVMLARARALQLPLEIIECDLATSARALHKPGTLRIHPVRFPEPVIATQLNIHNAGVVLQSLQLAIDACLQHQADALVTGPIHKSVMNDAGIPFTGHTEYLANACGVKQTVMLFVVDQLKAALVTTHLPLKDVPSAVTREKIQSVLRIMTHDLQKYFGITKPRILVAGLNPHAGENGHMGQEEINVITPALAQLRDEGFVLEGPLPADTIFTPSVLASGDAVLGMYHDQILPAIKQLGFDRAVNMTLGLPIIRTSVDHGTALPLAGSQKADAGSLRAAINLAVSVLPSLND